MSSGQRIGPRRLAGPSCERPTGSSGELFRPVGSEWAAVEKWPALVELLQELPTVYLMGSKLIYIAHFPSAVELGSCTLIFIAQRMEIMVAVLALGSTKPGSWHPMHLQTRAP